MIPIDFITEWRQVAPWPSNEQVEQDLIISRAIVEMFNLEQISKRLAWRGGTALHKLYLPSAPRYSEDIDLVQIDAEPIGETLDVLRRVLDPWLGEPQRVFKEGRVNLVYRIFSEGPPVVRLRLKIEIITREHYSECGYVKLPFSVESKWFQWECFGNDLYPGGTGRHQAQGALPEEERTRSLRHLDGPSTYRCEP